VIVQQQGLADTVFTALQEKYYPGAFGANGAGGPPGSKRVCEYSGVMCEFGDEPFNSGESVGH
jgi:hypothetical protein